MASERAELSAVMKVQESGKERVARWEMTSARPME